ncbi:putative Heat shock cognate 70 kDa protein [Hypsibius exemplaris]|uniref:Heat shock cognate 70 kDa protein n=1 Tax=Hypsibius exemplaris TaxID=2072580 RepID=A0A1W0WZM1_HYPEX|nr:putative Heat shock cognate 70 kDa protein [Hypsibius exemplaris]
MHKTALLSLDHPNIVRYICCGSVPGDPSNNLLYSDPRSGILMEYYPGGNLNTLAKKGNLILRDILRHLKQVANGLCYLHALQQQKPVIHGDLKGENIFLSEDQSPTPIIHGDLKGENIFLSEDRSTCRIGDMENLYLLTEGRTVTVRGPVNPGTVWHMSPELLFKTCNPLVPTRIGRATDIWSFGCVALELLNGGDVPYVNLQNAAIVLDRTTPERDHRTTNQSIGSEHQLLRHLDSGAHPDLSAMREVNAQVKEIVGRCLTHNAAERPTVGELVSALSSDEVTKQDVRGRKILPFTHSDLKPPSSPHQQMKNNDDIVLGIDFGMINSCIAACYSDGQVVVISGLWDRVKAMPSCVFFHDGEQQVGDQTCAKEHPENFIYEMERLLGRDFEDAEVQIHCRRWPFTLINERDAADHADGHLCAGQLLHPAKKRHKAAATLAGLNVIGIIDEPTAAALGYNAIDEVVPTGVTFMTFDFGERTLDVSVMEPRSDNVFKVLESAGDMSLGGADFDGRLLDHFIEVFWQKHRINLRQKGAFHWTAATCWKLVRKPNVCSRWRNPHKPSSSRMLKVQELLRTYFGQTVPVKLDHRMGETIAVGAAHYARKIADGNSPSLTCIAIPLHEAVYIFRCQSAQFMEILQ